MRKLTSILLSAGFISAVCATAGLAQTVANLPVTCNSAGTVCTQATPVVNPDGTPLSTGGGGSATPTGTAGSPNASVVTVQGITNGTPQNVVARGGGSLATGQVSAGTTSTQIVAARAGRQRVTVSVGAANACAFGNSGVTPTTGFALQPVAGATVTLETTAALFAACSAATTVSFVEQF